MGRLTGEGSDAKSQLVTSICNISNRAFSCARLHRPNPSNSHFIDWYLLFQVEENVGIDVIRKQYHKFALLLHPDKNKHPKADIAFKLVYEAYTCLKDTKRRAAFDLERENGLCKECSKIPHITSKPTTKKSTSTKLRALFSRDRSKPSKILQGMNDIKTRFEEEAGVIEKCLKMNAAIRNESTTFTAFGKEIHVFNPSDYRSDRYPHFRTSNIAKPENFWWLQKSERQKEKCDSPIFESRSDRISVEVSPVSVCLGSY